MKHILWQSAFWQINKKISREVWLEASLFLSYLIDTFYYFKEKWELNEIRWEEGYFFRISADIQNDLFLSNHKQKQAIKVLEKKWFIKTELAGIPAKLHFKVFENKILNFLKTGIEKIWKQECKNFKTNNNINNNNINNNTNLSKDKLETEVSCEKIIEDKRDFEIELIVETLKNINWWIIDDTVVNQRIYWKLIKDKIAKIHWFNWDYVFFIKNLYNHSDNYNKQLFTSLKKFYFSIAKIIAWIRKQFQESKVSVI